MLKMLDDCANSAAKDPSAVAACSLVVTEDTKFDTPSALALSPRLVRSMVNFQTTTIPSATLSTLVIAISLGEMTIALSRRPLRAAAPPRDWAMEVTKAASPEETKSSSVMPDRVLFPGTVRITLVVVGGNDGADEGAGVGMSEGLAVGNVVGMQVGSLDGRAVGELDGNAVGSLEGTAVGSKVGPAEGFLEGSLDGVAEGSLEGTEVGSAEGREVGSAEGMEVGALEGVAVGSSVGVGVGTAEGDKVG